MKISEGRQDEILGQMKSERKTIDRLTTDIANVTEDLKAKREEHKGRSLVVLKLVRELDVPEQTCTGCGVVRAVLEPVWNNSKKCPNCVSDEGIAKAKAALEKGK